MADANEVSTKEAAAEGTPSTGAGGSTKNRKMAVYGALGLTAVAVVVGLSVGLSQRSKNNQANATTSAAANSAGWMRGWDASSGDDWMSSKSSKSSSGSWGSKSSKGCSTKSSKSGWSGDSWSGSADGSRKLSSWGSSGDSCVECPCFSSGDLKALEKKYGVELCGANIGPEYGILFTPNLDTGSFTFACAGDGCGPPPGIDGCYIIEAGSDPIFATQYLQYPITEAEADSCISLMKDRCPNPVVPDGGGDAAAAAVDGGLEWPFYSP